MNSYNTDIFFSNYCNLHSVHLELFIWQIALCYERQLHYPFTVEILPLSIFCAIRWNDLKVFGNRWSSVINTKSNIVSSSTFYSTQGGMMSPVLVALKVLCLRWSQQTLILVRSSDTYRLQSSQITLFGLLVMSSGLNAIGSWSIGCKFVGYKNYCCSSFITFIRFRYLLHLYKWPFKKYCRKIILFSTTSHFIPTFFWNKIQF